MQHVVPAPRQGHRFGDHQRPARWVLGAAVVLFASRFLQACRFALVQHKWFRFIVPSRLCLARPIGQDLFEESALGDPADVSGC